MFPTSTITKRPPSVYGDFNGSWHANSTNTTFYGLENETSFTVYNISKGTYNEEL